MRSSTRRADYISLEGIVELMKGTDISTAVARGSPVMRNMIIFIPEISKVAKAKRHTIIIDIPIGIGVDVVIDTRRSTWTTIIIVVIIIVIVNAINVITGVTMDTILKSMKIAAERTTHEALMHTHTREAPEKGKDRRMERTERETKRKCG